jgi:hypothetical protein
MVMRVFLLPKTCPECRAVNSMLTRLNTGGKLQDDRVNLFRVGLQIAARYDKQPEDYLPPSNWLR